MPYIAAGVVKFQNEIFPEKQKLFGDLDTGQAPGTLFITCSDSRIDPNLITQTEPGELFICRNAGNIVPPHSKYTGGITASIEYAVAVLNVEHIVVCGHTRCGAMAGAMNPESVKSMPHVDDWLSYARAAVQVTEEKGKDLNEDDKMNLLVHENVLLQIQHLKTHPYVAAHLAAGKLDIHGWVYNIKTGEVDAYEDDNKGFLPVDERYAKQVALVAEELTKGASCG